MEEGKEYKMNAYISVEKIEDERCRLILSTCPKRNTVVDIVECNGNTSDIVDATFHLVESNNDAYKCFHVIDKQDNVIEDDSISCFELTPLVWYTMEEM